jgi:hydrogenase maturation protease
MGNPVLSDDRIGLLAVAQAREAFSATAPAGTGFAENHSGGFDLLYELEGFDEVLIVDCMCSGQCAPGTLIELDLCDIAFVAQPRLVDSHGLNLPTLLDAGRQCGMAMPSKVSILGIEGQDFQTFSETPTPDVLAALPAAVAHIGGFLGIAEPTPLAVRAAALTARAVVGTASATRELCPQEAP